MPPPIPAASAGWLQPPEACVPHRRPQPAAPRREEHGLPEVQPLGPEPVCQICAAGHALRAAQCSGVSSGLDHVVHMCAAAHTLSVQSSANCASQPIRPYPCGPQPGRHSKPTSCHEWAAVLDLLSDCFCCRDAHGPALQSCTTGGTRIWGTCRMSSSGQSSSVPTLVLHMNTSL